MNNNVLLLPQVGPVPRSPYTVVANGSLVLHPVSKDHQGEWECHATNRVASTTTSTILLVLGELGSFFLAVSAFLLRTALQFLFFFMADDLDTALSLLLFYVALLCKQL